MKKTSCLLVVALMCFLFAPPVTALGAVTPKSSGTITPYYVGISSFVPTLSIDSSGNATAKAKVVASNNTYDIDLFVELQKYNSSSKTWSTLKSWSGSGTGYAGAIVSGTYKVSSGTYRTKATATVYNTQGRFVDEAVGYSPSKTY